MPASPPFSQATYLQSIESEKRVEFLQRVSNAVLKPVMADMENLKSELEKVSFESVDLKEKLVWSEEIADHIVQALAVSTIGPLDQQPVTENMDDYPRYADSVKRALAEIGEKLKSRFDDQMNDHEDVAALKEEVGTLNNRYIVVEKAMDAMDEALKDLDQTTKEHSATLQAMEQVPQNVTDLRNSVESLTNSVEKVVAEVSSLRKDFGGLSERVEEAEKSSDSKFLRLAHDIHQLFGLFKGIEELLGSSITEHEENGEQHEEYPNEIDEYGTAFFGLDDDDFDDFQDEPKHGETHAKLASRGLRSRLRP